MLKLILLFISSAFLMAEDIALSLSHHNGSISYSVRSNNTQKLSSTLNFPFKFETIEIKYTHDFKYLQVGLSYSTLINNTITTGKDYDWKNQDLTVYSKSDSKIEKYNNFGIVAYKNVYTNLNLLAGFNYLNINTNWYDTYQMDFVSNDNKKLNGKTLQYDQKFYKYRLGLNYEKFLGSHLLLILQPSALYVHINTKDTHILRNFYTIQNINTLGYEALFGLKYKLTKTSQIKLAYTYTKFTKDQTDMKYYNSFGKNYITFPSSYNFYENKINISCTYKF